MTDAVDLRADCARCAALCCMSLAFDKSSSFAINKPAGSACPNLKTSGECAIYGNRKQRGFSGCTVYDCLGAGQRVTQDVFEGRNWLAEPHLKDRMTRAFTVMRQIHDLLSTLTAAEALPLDAAERRTLAEFCSALNPPGGWSEEALDAAPVEQIAVDVNVFLRSLHRHVADARKPA